MHSKLSGEVDSLAQNLHLRTTLYIVVSGISEAEDETELATILPWIGKTKLLYG